MKLSVIGCNGPYPAPQGACSGYLVEGAGGGSVMLDMGSGVLPALLAKMDVLRLDALILSHLHADHMSDALVLRYLLERRQSRLTVYAPDSPSNIRALFESTVFEWHTLSDGLSVQSGEFSLDFLRVNHPVECYATRITENGKSIVYSGDTNTCPELADFARDTDLFLCDGGINERDWKPQLPHLSPKRAAQIASDARAKQFVVTHLSPDSDVDSVLAEAKSEFDGAVVAKNGAVYYVGDGVLDVPCPVVTTVSVN